MENNALPDNLLYLIFTAATSTPKKSCELFGGGETASTLTLYRATVPANTTATLYLPASSAQAVKEGGKDAGAASGVTFVKYEGGRAVYSLKSGSYEFTANR